MEELQATIDGLAEQRDDLLNYLKQFDPESDDFIKVQKALAKNAETMVAVMKSAKELENESNEKEIHEKDNKTIIIKTGMESGTKFGVALITIIGTLLTLDRIYKYETEALMPGNKVNLGTSLFRLIKP